MARFNHKLMIVSIILFTVATIGSSIYTPSTFGRGLMASQVIPVIPLDGTDIYLPILFGPDGPLRLDLPAVTAEQVGNYSTVSRWEKTNITYFFQNGTNDIAGDDERQAIRDAFRIWGEQIPVSFSEVGNAANADIILLWGMGQHGDPYPFDGVNGVLAHAYFPPHGDAHFDDSETWTLTQRNSYGQPIDLVTVAIHEIGHSLGLGHSDDSTAVMYAYYGTSRRQLQADDITGIQSLYPNQKDWETYQTFSGDVNGDGRTDLVWNSTENQNTIYVGLADANGILSFLQSQTHPSSGWAGYQTLLGDVNGDHRTDLIWNSKSTSGNINRIYVGLATGNGTFLFQTAQDHPAQGWDGYETLIGDVNGDGRTDLVWNSKTTAGDTNRVYVALGQSNGSFKFLSSQDHPAKGWQSYRTLMDDINGDGREDLIWNSVSSGTTNRTYVALAAADGTFSFLSGQDHPAQGWQFYKTLTGDVNGDGRSDLIWNQTLDSNRTYIGLGQIDGTIQFLPHQDRTENGWDSYQTLTGDVNNDGRIDLIWNSKTTTNRTYVGLGRSDGTLDFLAAQDHTASGWHSYKAQNADVNGDGRSDLIWNETIASNRTYIALANSNGTFSFLPFQDHP